MLKNRKISTILFTAFGLVILFMLILIVGNLIARKLMLENYTNLSSGILSRQLLFTEIERDYYLLRGSFKDMIRDVDNLQSDINELKVAELSNDISNKFTKAFNSLDNDTLKNLIDPNGDEFEKRSMTNIETIMNEAFISKINILMELAPSQRYEIESELEEASIDIEKMLAEYQYAMENKASLTEQTLIDNSEGFTRLIIILSAFIIIVGVMLSIVSLKAIRAQIKPISLAANKVRIGHFDVSLMTNNDNEMGKLSNDIGDVVNIFQSLLDEINRVADEFASGQLSSKIDISRFTGEYRNTAISINNLLDALVGDIKDILKCIENFSHGNFDVNVKQYRNEKAVINTTVEKISFNLQAVNYEINEIVKQASNGNLDVEINERKYEGDWMSIMKSLNQLIVAVRNPVKEVLTALEVVSKADFSVRIETLYSGQFEAMKNSFNFMVSTVSDYIHDISDVLNQVANQNLGIKIKREYIGDFAVVKRDINTMIDIFSRLIIEFNEAAVNLAFGSKQISDNNSGLAHGASTQAESVVELNAAIEQMSTINTENVRTAKSAGDSSKEIYEYGIIGKEKMNKMLHSVEKIQESSNNIMRVISVIDTITFQINLLALNAAVEAARAGEAGKGFSVVAQEVRSLAERSKAAATETAGHVKQAVDSIKEGIATTADTSEAINLILTNIDKISSTIQKVQETSKEQESHIELVKGELSHIVEIAHQNTSASEENASSSEELTSQAEILKQMLSRFVI